MDPPPPGFLVSYVISVLPQCIRSFTADFLQKCLSTPESSSDQVSLPRATLRSQSPVPLLKEWAKLRLTEGPWKDALVTAAGVSLLLLWYPSWA